MSTTPSSSSAITTKSTAARHAVSPLEKQRFQLERLFKDPSKPAFIPPPPIAKTVRPAREMMKNVQGSSAGAGSGEFHVYKAGRRREYERIKLMEEESQKELVDAEFDKKRREAEEQANAKTAKNRAKRQKKKEKAKAKGNNDDNQEGSAVKSSEADDKNELSAPVKKRRLVSGRELVFRRPGEESEGSEEEDAQEGRSGPEPLDDAPSAVEASVAVRHAETHAVVIHEDD